jgi:hypothetical protein
MDELAFPRPLRGLRFATTAAKSSQNYADGGAFFQQLEVTNKDGPPSDGRAATDTGGIAILYRFRFISLARLCNFWPAPERFCESFRWPGKFVTFAMRSFRRNRGIPTRRLCSQSRDSKVTNGAGTTACRTDFICARRSAAANRGGDSCWIR